MVNAHSIRPKKTRCFSRSSSTLSSVSVSTLRPMSTSSTRSKIRPARVSERKMIRQRFSRRELGSGMGDATPEQTPASLDPQGANARTHRHH